MGKKTDKAVRTQSAPGNVQAKSSVPFSIIVALAVVALAIFAVKLCWLPSRSDASATGDRKAASRTADEPALKPSVAPTGVGKSWWARDGGLRLKSVHALQIDTMNFNSTVTDPKRPRVLIAYYDPRSESFQALHNSLDAIADQLATLNQGSEPLGHLGSVDVTTQTYLGVQQAPEMPLGWQQSAQEQGGAFKFGRPRFFPVILAFYRNGVRVGEYTGVVSPKQVVHFLKLHRRKVGGSMIANDTSLNKFLKGPGPIALSCGLASATPEHEAFNKTAHYLHGALAFGLATVDICSKVLKMELTSPQVALTRGDGAALASNHNVHFANASTMSNSTLLSTWLEDFHGEVLEEMTPDNSHTFLEFDSKPLALLLVNTKDAVGRAKAEAMFQPIEKELRADWNLVWSDCQAFGSQFKAEKECPVVVSVDPDSLDYEKNSVANLTTGDGTPSLRLSSWLRSSKAHDTFSKKMEFFHNQTKAIEAARNASDSNAVSNNSSNTTTRSPPPEPVPETAEYEDHLDGHRPDFTNSSEEQLFGVYNALLDSLNVLRRSYVEKYSHLPFDFRELDNAQKTHHSMRLLVDSREDVLAKLQNLTRLTWLWGAVEQRSKFVRKVQNANFSNQKNLSKDLQNVQVNLEMATTGLFILFKRLIVFLHNHARKGTMGVPKPAPRQMERRSASTLSVRDFYDQYARPGKPVIITDLKITKGEPWTLDYFKKRCFNKTAPFQMHKEHMKSWGRLAHAGSLPLNEFIDSFNSNATRRSWYLHDWSLPRNCPAAFGPAPYPDFTIPKYFAGDYFQRAGFEGYQHSWPSLFIGSNETQSKMHIDSGNTHFWLHLLSGRKEWRFYSRNDQVNLYKDVMGAHFWFDVFNPDKQKFPLTDYAEMHTGIQEAGELVFIPAGNPHAVRNLEAIHAISMNYVDASNVDLYLLDQIGNANWETVEMFTDGTTIPHGLRSDQEPLTFGEWKSVPWHSLKYDISSFDLASAAK